MKLLSLKQFIKKSRNIHGKKYDYSKCIYKNARTKVNIICDVHGIFSQRPTNHIHGRTSGQGCPKCKYEYLNKINTSSTKVFVKKAKNIHGKKYDYSLVNYTHSKICLEIICKKHGKFLQRANDHLMGHGCPKCINIISNKEKCFLDYLKIPDTKKNRQVLIARKKVDGLKENTIYEFLGDYWHGNPFKFESDDYNKICKKTYGELYHDTIRRFEKLKDMGYKIQYIWESDWKMWEKNMLNNIPIKQFKGNKI